MAPVLGTWAGATARAFGALSSVKRVVTDAFTRTTSGTLGTADSGATWISWRGTWFGNGTQAQSNDAASGYSIAAVDVGQNVTVSAAVSEGTGVVVWLSDAGSWWSSTAYGSVSSYTCGCGTCCNSCPNSACTCATYNSCADVYPGGGGNCSGCGSYQDPTTCGGYSAGNLYGSCIVCNGSSITQTGSYCSGAVYGMSSPPACSTTATYSTHYNFSCVGGMTSSSCAANGWTWHSSYCPTSCDAGPYDGAPYTYDGYTTTNYTYTCVTSSTPGAFHCNSCVHSSCTCATYNTCPSCANCGSYSCGCSTCYQNNYYLRLLKSVSGAVSQATGDISVGTAPIAAISVQTSGDSLTAKAYSDTAMTTQIGTVTITPAGPNKGSDVGIIKAPTSITQGSVVDSFSAQST